MSVPISQAITVATYVLKQRLLGRRRYPLVLMLGRRRLTSSAGAGSDEIREMLAFSAKHDIYPEVELIEPDYLNTALKRLEKNDVRFRFVMDLTQGL